MSAFSWIKRNVTVEPVWMLGLIALSIRLLIQPAGILLHVCQNNYANEDEMRCDDASTWPKDIENQIHKEAANWDIFVTISYLAPALLANTFFGAWGDLAGRQINILVSLAGLTIAALGMELVFSQTLMSPLSLLVVFGLVTGFTGFIALLNTSCYAYIADITPNSQTQSIRMAIFYASGTLASAIGSLGVSKLSNYVPLTTQAVISQVAALLGFGYTLLHIKQIPPALLTKFTPLETVKGGDLDPIKAIKTVEEPVKGYGPVRFLKFICKLCWDAVVCYFKPREGHKRAFLVTLALIIFVVATVTSEPVQQYTFRTSGEGALGWDISDLGLWTAVSKILIMIIGGGGMVIMKKYGVRDTTITVLSLASLCLKWFVIGLSTKTWHMYVAAVLGGFAEISSASMLSFMAQLVEPDEVGKLYTVVGFAFELSVILSKVGYNSIYKATLDLAWPGPGFMFIFAAGLVLICTIGCIWIHIVAKKENVGHDIVVEKEKEHRGSA